MVESVLRMIDRSEAYHGPLARDQTWELERPLRPQKRARDTISSIPRHVDGHEVASCLLNLR